MVFIETPAFMAWRDEFLGDELFSDLVNLLLADPGRGDRIPATRGIRKIRVQLPGRGKRGGARVIYFHWVSEERIYLLYGYAKNVQADLSRDQLRKLALLMDEDLGNG